MHQPTVAITSPTENPKPGIEAATRRLLNKAQDQERTWQFRSPRSLLEPRGHNVSLTVSLSIFKAVLKLLRGSRGGCACSNLQLGRVTEAERELSRAELNQLRFTNICRHGKT